MQTIIRSVVAATIIACAGLVPAAAQAHDRHSGRSGFSIGISIPYQTSSYRMLHPGYAVRGYQHRPAYRHPWRRPYSYYRYHRYHSPWSWPSPGALRFGYYRID